MVYKVLEETVTDEEQGQRLTYGMWSAIFPINAKPWNGLSSC